MLETSRRQRSVRQALDELWPPSIEYQRLLARRAEVTASGDLTTVQIAAGPIIKPGQTSDRVVLLKERLMGPGDHTSVYDDDLKQEVIAFQLAAGLEGDGAVGGHTLNVLNETRVSWIDRIDANLERWRWLPRQTPPVYVRVNIAAYSLRVIDRGDTVLSMNVIVGKPYRRTPVFTESIKYLVLNPDWNVPTRIAVEDKLPLLKKNAAAEAAKGFEVQARGIDAFVPVDTIDWSGVERRNFHYLLRQRPGEGNALGRIKFMLPNPYAVYLHDTPGRELFTRQERSFSSGCVRLERPLDLARWLLARERHPAADRLDELIASEKTQAIYLKQPIPTYIVYFTAFMADDGDIVFRRDIYDRDKAINAALKGAVH